MGRIEGLKRGLISRSRVIRSWFQLLPQADMKYIVYLLVHLVLILGGMLVVLLPLSLSWQSPLGMSLVASGISGYVVFVYVVISRRVSDQLDVLQRFGFVHAFPSRATRIKHEYEQRLVKAKSNIDVLAFGLSALLEDLGEDFETWKTRAKVRILIIDPEYPVGPTNGPVSSLADLRDRDEGRDPGTIRSHVQKFVRQTSDLVDDNFQVRLYKCLPTINIFRVDGEIFWGPYLVQEQGRNTPTFLVRHGIMFKALLRHFEKIWKSSELSREVPDTWYDES